MLLDVAKELSKIILILFIILGTIGNILNLFIFTRPTLLRSSCTLYFIATSIDNLLAIYVAILYRLLIDGFSIDLGSYSDIICKGRAYLGYIFLSASPYFFILACFDRYCSSSSSARYRSWCNKKTAKKCIFAAIVLAAILYSHILMYFQVQKIGPNVVCYPQLGVYNFFWSMYYIVVYCFAPCICLIIVGILTLLNVRRQLRQIQPNGTNSGTIHRRLDRNLIQMLFSQILTQLICILPFTIINLLGMFINATTVQYMFLKKFFTIPFFAGYVTNFYVYTMASRIYRQELMKILGSFNSFYK